MHIVLCNCPPNESLILARALVHERLAACVNVIPGVTSIYSWNGEICEDQEHTLLIKVSSAKCLALTARLAELHSYEVPEILVLDPNVQASAAGYMAWVKGV